MKTKFLAVLSLLFLGLAFATSCSDDPEATGDSYYWYENEKIALKKNPRKATVVYHPSNEVKLKEILNTEGLEITDVEGYRDWDSWLTLTSAGREFLNDYKLLIVEGECANASAALPYTIMWNPFYTIVKNNAEVSVYFSFYAKPKQSVNLSEFERLAEENNVILLGELIYLRGAYELACTNASKHNVVVTANIFFESGLCEFAEPCLNGRIIPAGI